MKNEVGTKAMATGLSSLAIAGVVVVVVVGGGAVVVGGAVVAANDKCWKKNIQQLCFSSNIQ